MNNFDFNTLFELTMEVSLILWNEPEALRPANVSDQPGGLLCLKPDLPTMIVPDLHNRHQLLEKLLHYKFEEGKTVQQALALGEVQVLLLGDLIHSENSEIWLKAAEEYRKRYYTSKAIDFEMWETFQTIQMVLELKSKYPDFFHILKGNHENILSSSEEGNRSLAKYAAESKMVKAWLGVRDARKWMEKYAAVESHFPLLAIGKGFVASHAQPKQIFTRNELVEGLGKEEVVFGLTWTREAQAEEGAISAMKKELLGAEQGEKGYWIAGHTSVSKSFELKEEGLVLFHNPENMQVLRVDPGQELDLDHSVIQLPR